MAQTPTEYLKNIWDQVGGVDHPPAEWLPPTTVSSPNGAPSLSTDGEDIEGAGFTLFRVALGSATSVSLKVWLLATGDDTWFVPPGGVFEDVTDSCGERVATSGMERMYIEITATDGDAITKIGPCRFVA